MDNAQSKCRKEKGLVEVGRKALSSLMAIVLAIGLCPGLAMADDERNVDIHGAFSILINPHLKQVQMRMD